MRVATVLICASISLLSFSVSTYADSEKKIETNSPKNTWHLLLGAGSSHPGWGATQEKVKTTDVILRHQRPQTFTRGSGWYLNRKSVLVEIPFTYLREPDEPGMIGFTMNVNWTFVAAKRLQPFIFIGGGPVYTKAEIPGTSSQIRGSYQAGAGITYGTDRFSLIFEARYHHLSNGGVKEPNNPLNSSKFLFGLKLPF